MAGLLVALLALVPLFVVADQAAETGPRAAVRLLMRPRVGELLSNTVRVTLAAAAACGVVGVAAAWLVERTTLPGRRMWHILLAAPLAVPAFVNSFTWVSLTPRVEGFGGAVLISTLSYFPLVYLPVVATLRGLDPALESSARSLGDGPARTFFRVVLPQLRPALCGGMLLVVLHLLSEFGALQMLRFPTFTTAILDQYQSTFNSTAANLLAMVLVFCCLLALLAEIGLRGRGRYARIGAGAARGAPRVRLGRATPLALLPVAALVVLALGVPLGGLAYWLTVGSSASFPLRSLLSVATTSIGLGLAGALVTTVLALPVAWLAVRRPGPLSTLTERAVYVGHALPGIVIALALVTASIHYARPFYQTAALLLTAYAIMFLPLAVVSVRAGLAQAPPVLDDAARSLGASPLTALRRVTLPLVAPSLGTGVALVFLAIVTELTATLLLSPIGTHTLATMFWARADEIAYGAAAPYAALMVLISLPATYLLTHYAGRAGRG